MELAGYITAKEGTKAVPFYKDLYRNSKMANVGAAVVAADHSSGTIEKTDLSQHQQNPRQQWRVYF